MGRGRRGLRLVAENISALRPSLPNDSTPGTVTQADYDVLASNFGQTAGAALGVNTNAAVPNRRLRCY